MKRRGRPVGWRTPVFSLERAKLLSMIKEKPMNISQLSREMNLGRATIYHHLNHLKKNNLVIQNKQSTKKGQPVYIRTNKAKPLPTTFFNGLDLAKLGLKIVSVKTIKKKKK